MSIRATQLDRLANTIIEQSLEQGQIPTVSTILNGIVNMLDGSLPGTPITKVPKLFGVTDPVALTTTTNQILGDIEDLYTESISQVNRLVNVFDQTFTLQSNLRAQLISLQKNITTNTPGGIAVINGRIDGYSSITTNSSVWVNPRVFSASLPELPGKTRPLLNPVFTVAPNGHTTLVLGKPSDLGTSLSNTGYIARVLGTAGGHTLRISVSYKEHQQGSQVRIVFASSNTLSITLKVNGAEIGTKKTTFGNELFWTFPSRPIHTIELDLFKPKPDAGHYYDYAIRQVAVTQASFAPNATLTFQPFNLGSVGTVILNPLVDIPSGTQINWQIGLAGPNGSFSSIEPNTKVVISQPVILDNKQVMPVRSAASFAVVSNRVADQTTGVTDGDLPIRSNQRASRAPLFALCRINTQIARGMSYVRRGRNAWNVLSYHYDVQQSGINSDPLPTIADFQNPRGNPTPVIYQRYQPTEMFLSTQFPNTTPILKQTLRLPAAEYATNSINDRVMHLFEAYLNLDATLAPNVLLAFNKLQINLPFIFASKRAALYLNGTSISVQAVNIGSALNYQATLPLRPGSNTLRIVTNNYTSLAGAPFDVGTGASVPGGTGILTPFVVDAGPITWYADPGPMTEVTLFELQQQTSRGDQTRYALAQDNLTSKQVLLVRELPTTCYDITTQAFTNVSNNTTIQATLTGSLDPSLTPVVYGFDLTNQTAFDKTQLLRQSQITLGVPTS